MTDQPHITCRDCRHWDQSRHGTDLNEYPRDRSPADGYADGACAKRLHRLEITCSARWDRCTVDSVETYASFYCTFAEAKS